MDGGIPLSLFPVANGFASEEGIVGVGGLGEFSFERDEESNDFLQRGFGGLPGSHGLEAAAFDVGFDAFVAGEVVGLEHGGGQIHEAEGGHGIAATEGGMTLGMRFAESEPSLALGILLRGPSFARNGHGRRCDVNFVGDVAGRRGGLTAADDLEQRLLLRGRGFFGLDGLDAHASDEGEIFVFLLLRMVLGRAQRNSLFRRIQLHQTSLSVRPLHIALALSKRKKSSSSAILACSHCAKVFAPSLAFCA